MSHYPFELKPLPYAYDALEPFIDTKTMQLHHDKHLKTYVDNLNTALKDYPQYHTWDIERLLKSIGWLPENIRTPVKNNAGGVYNHELYFAGMTGDKGTEPSQSLLEQINLDYGGLDNLKDLMKKAALGVFGSGYAWLALDGEGNLVIKMTALQDTLISAELRPVLIVDVWEHAYYLKHYNVRADYLNDWLNIINWHAASELYEKCKPGT